VKKLLAIFLILTVMLSLAACGGDSDPTSQPTQDTAPSTQPTDSQPDTDTMQTISYFTMTMGDEDTQIYMTAYPDDNGNTYVEYQGTEKKVGTLPASVQTDIATALRQTSLAELRDVSEYTEGTASASMYITFTDDTYLSADFSGTIAQEFSAAYEFMDKFFQDLTAELPVYVPRPVIIDEFTGDELDAAIAILEGSGIEPLDSMTISSVIADGELKDYAGLSGADGVTGGVIVAPLMMTTPYSLTIVSTDDADQINNIRQDFADNIEWNHWVCVSATNALIAQKDNMVLFLLGSDSLYAGTSAAIEAAGWTNIETFSNSSSDIITDEAPLVGLAGEINVGIELPNAAPAV